MGEIRAYFWSETTYFPHFHISKLSPTWNEPWIFINCTKSRCSTIAVKHKSLFSPDLSILIFHRSCGHLSHFSSIRLSPKILPVKLGGVSIPHICHFLHNRNLRSRNDRLESALIHDTSRLAAKLCVEFYSLFLISFFALQLENFSLG